MSIHYNTFVMNYGNIEDIHYCYSFSTEATFRNLISLRTYFYLYQLLNALTYSLDK